MISWCWCWYREGEDVCIGFAVGLCGFVVVAGFVGVGFVGGVVCVDCVCSCGVSLGDNFLSFDCGGGMVLLLVELRLVVVLLEWLC